MMNFFLLSLRTVKMDFDVQIEALEHYLKDTATFADVKSKDLEMRVKQLAEESDDPDMVYDYFAEDFKMYDSRYKSIGNNSILVMLCSLYESFLKDFALQVERFILRSESLTKKKTMSLANYKEYIAKHTKLDFSTLDPLVNQIYPMTILRNKIIHYGTNLLDGDRSVEDIRDFDILNAIPYLKIDIKNGEYYITDKKLVFDFIDLLKTYFSGYYQILNNVDKTLTGRNPKAIS
jgi:hypothetical protein